MSGFKKSEHCETSDEPVARFTYCYGHSLNRTAPDSMKQLTQMQSSSNIYRSATQGRSKLGNILKETALGNLSVIRVLCTT